MTAQHEPRPVPLDLPQRAAVVSLVGGQDEPVPAIVVTSRPPGRNATSQLAGTGRTATVAMIRSYVPGRALVASTVSTVGRSPTESSRLDDLCVGMSCGHEARASMIIV